MKVINSWLKKRKTLLLGIGSTLIMLMILTIIMNWIIMPWYTHQGSELELPDATEMEFDKAKIMLEAQSFKVIMDKKKFSEIYPENIVISHYPSPFTKVKKGRRIYLIVSAGHKKVSVPDLIGISKRDAEFKLKLNSLVPGEFFYEYNNYQPRGVVCGQSLERDTKVEKGTAVDITVSNGRRPNHFIVPDVVGKSIQQAKNIIRSAGFRVGKISYEIFEDLLPDTVIRQSLDVGDEDEQGTLIDLVVSKLREDQD